MNDSSRRGGWGRGDAGLRQRFIAVMVAGGAFAQSGQRYNSYSPGIDEGLVMINAGVGRGFSACGMGIPPISLSADFKLPISLPITVGVIGAFSTWTYDVYLYDIVYTNIGIGARAAYHFGFLKNLDTYVGLTLGYVIQTADVKGKNGASYTGGAYDGVSFFLYGGYLGARYFFTNNIGAYLEPGYSGLQVVSAGLSLKF